MTGGAAAFADGWGAGAPFASLTCAEPDEQRRRAVALALSHMPFLGPTSWLQAMRRLTATRLQSLSATGVGALRQRAARSGSQDPLPSGRHWLQLGERAAESLTRLGVGCIFLWQPGYPRWLREVLDPHLVLYYRGRRQRRWQWSAPGTPPALAGRVGSGLATSWPRQACRWCRAWRAASISPHTAARWPAHRGTIAAQRLEYLGAESITSTRKAADNYPGGYWKWGAW